MEALHSTNSESHSSDSTQQPPQAKKKKEDETAMSFLLGTCDSDSPPSWKEQFQIEPHDCCALDWWKTNEFRFPTLAKLVKQYHCVPATSVPAERVFSVAGLVINDKRASLTPENADMLIFMNKNGTLS